MGILEGEEEGERVGREGCGGWGWERGWGNLLSLAAHSYTSAKTLNSISTHSFLLGDG